MEILELFGFSMKSVKHADSFADGFQSNNDHKRSLLLRYAKKDMWFAH